MGFTPAFKPAAHPTSKKPTAAKSKNADSEIYNEETVRQAAKNFMKSKKPMKSVASPKFQAGDKTQWHSQAGGKKTTKAGTVLAFVPRGSNAYESLHTKFGLTVPSDVANLSLRFGRAISRTPRYLVRVNGSGESTNPAKSRRIAQIYAVPATVIERQNQPATKTVKRIAKKPSTKSIGARNPTFLTPVGPFSHI